MKLEKLKKMHIAILGLGIEGLTTADYFLSHGITKFSIYDIKSEEELASVGDDWKRVFAQLKKHHVPLHLGKEWSREDMNDVDFIIRSPDISLQKSYLGDFSKDQISSQTKLFFDNFNGKIIGVTGTKGKGTTSSLIYEMLKKAGFDAYLGGNIGKPPITFLDTLTPQSIVVLELSSFQLQDMEKSPNISVMVMVTQEHLDAFGDRNYHTSLEEYYESKRNIFSFQHVDDIAVLNIDYPATKESAKSGPAKVAWVSRYQEVENGCFVRGNEVILRANGEEKKVIDVSEILLPGGHNLENVCAAAMAAYFAGVGIDDIAFVLRTFKGLEHRLELVREVKGIRYYDDSFSTTPETAIAAIQAFSEPEIIILGGSKKGSDFTDLGKAISETSNIKAIIGIGIEWPTIRSKMQEAGFRENKVKIFEECKNMEEIVKKANELAESGDVVLLSPACASFDMFKNYKERGNLFKKFVNEL